MTWWAAGRALLRALFVRDVLAPGLRAIERGSRAARTRSEFGDDLAALIAHLRLDDVRLIAQSMGGCSALEYMLNHPHNVRALVLASTCGTIHKPSVPLPDRQQLENWQSQAATARADMQQRGVAPPAGERMAREQPDLHFLYREIANVSSSFDREALRKRNAALSTRSPEVLRGITVPTWFITGGEDTTYPPFLSDALAPLMPNARVEQVADADIWSTSSGRRSSMCATASVSTCSI